MMANDNIQETLATLCFVMIALQMFILIGVMINGFTVKETAKEYVFSDQFAQDVKMAVGRSEAFKGA